MAEGRTGVNEGIQRFRAVQIYGTASACGAAGALPSPSSKSCQFPPFREFFLSATVFFPFFLGLGQSEGDEFPCPDIHFCGGRRRPPPLQNCVVKEFLCSPASQLITAFLVIPGLYKLSAIVTS